MNRKAAIGTFLVAILAGASLRAEVPADSVWIDVQFSGVRYQVIERCARVGHRAEHLRLVVCTEAVLC